MTNTKQTTIRKICVVTVARSDFGIYRPVLNAIQNEPSIELGMLVTGMHLSPEFGMTISEIEEEGFPIAGRVDMKQAQDTPKDIAQSMGRGVSGMAGVYADYQPDIICVLGDRTEMLAAATAAVPFNIPIAHIHGGELSFGAIDDAIRHAITKLSHIHFVSTEPYAKRVRQLGENPSHIVVSGAPSLDNLKTLHLPTTEELEASLEISLSEPPILVTHHPETRAQMPVSKQIAEVLAALDEFDCPILFTKPNADAGGRAIIEAIEAFCQAKPHRWCVDNLGTAKYFALMKIVKAMVGNSSSGILEAASFKLPVVNIGNRQKGRIQADNVINSTCEKQQIISAIRDALSETMSKSLKNIKNPYGDGRAAQRIVDKLKSIQINEALLAKEFVDQNME